MAGLPGGDENKQVGKTERSEKMQQLTKKISKMIDIPDVWEWNPLKDDGSPIFEEPKTFELGGGKIKIFSMSEEDFSTVREDSMRASVGSTGEVTVLVSDKKMKENLFSARCGGEKGSWVGFLDEAGEQLNSNPKNQKRFVHLKTDGHFALDYFVTKHIGPMLDKIANDEASAEEKNWFASPNGQAGDATESTPRAAKHAKGHGPKG